MNGTLPMLRALFLGLPAAVIVFGIVLLIAGAAQAPRDDAAAQAFRNDPSCAADMAKAPAASGACSVVDATIATVYIGPTDTQALRNASAQPAVQLRLPDGTVRNADLAGRDGRAFVKAIYPGTTARAQLFRGEVARVAAGGIAAETMSAPDVMAASDAKLPWVGAGLIIVGFGAFRVLRRLAGTKEGVHA